MKFQSIHITAIKPTAPFNFNATFHKPDHFASGDNYWEPNNKWQTFWWNKECLGVKLTNVGLVEKPEITVEIYSDKKLAPDFIKGFIKEMFYRYNLDFDLIPFCKKFSKHEVLGATIAKMHGMRPGHQDSLYEYLIVGLMLQNCTVKRSVQMMQTLFERYGTLLEFDGKKLWCFWEPGNLTNVAEEELRGLKIGYRAKSLYPSSSKLQLQNLTL